MIAIRSPLRDLDDRTHLSIGRVGQDRGLLPRELAYMVTAAARQVNANRIVPTHPLNGGGKGKWILPGDYQRRIASDLDEAGRIRDDHRRLGSPRFYHRQAESLVIRST